MASPRTAHAPRRPLVRAPPFVAMLLTEAIVKGAVKVDFARPADRGSQVEGSVAPQLWNNEHLASALLAHPGRRRTAPRRCRAVCARMRPENVRAEGVRDVRLRVARLFGRPEVPALAPVHKPVPCSTVPIEKEKTAAGNEDQSGAIGGNHRGVPVGLCARGGWAEIKLDRCRAQQPLRLV